MKDNTNTMKLEIEQPEYAQSCLICGKTIATYDFPIRENEICEDCKKAVAFAKERLKEKEELENER